MQDETKKPSKAIIAMIVVALLAAATAGGVYLINSNPSTTESNTTPTTTNNETVDDAPNATTAGEFKDGTYSATGEYTSPGGRESIDVELTLAGNAISDITVTPHPAAGTSVQYQTEFADNFKPLVVGKAIDEVNLSRVAGSSLTSTGFNDALDQIEAKAAV